MSKIPPNSEIFYVYYRVRIANLDCDNKAWGESCDRVAVGLKTEYQCNLLPEKCKTDPQISDLYKSACAESSFARELRDTDSGASSVFYGITSVLTTMFAFSIVVL